ncbi:hypothetical protein [Maribacter sp. 4G9]|uniref:hypothetical protein n=1 Tax=Maribacter sp. 4G9 TaxID=1889777 RepID=UPI000C145EFE|nr:hypothetical protein [Maribacter sp. 4G9]PIB27890.1 hypothetical protein BFP75_06390 [Maribacter sp. 4G9]
MSSFDTMVQRNLMGKRLEKEGRVLEAKALYEANISESFEGSFPYRRLAILYRKGKYSREEIRVLEKAVSVFQSLIETGREDIRPKLIEFKERLEKTKLLNSK